MGTRAVALYLRQAGFKNFYALGMDYAWGHNSIGVFKDEVKKAGKNFIADVYSPIGTKDFSTYITKIRQSGADACYLVLQGDDNNAFLSQAKQYRLGDKVQLLTEIVDLNSIHAVGDAAIGLIGGSRYTFTFPGEANAQFVAAWQKEYGNVPDVFEGEQWQACLMLQAGIEKAGSIDADKLRPALETVEIDSIKGKVAMRACDHQAVQQGFMVKVVQKDGFKDPGPGPDRHLPGRSDHARLPPDDLRQLMDFLAFLVTQCLNALSQAALLFFLGCGLTLIFGIMRIVNFAHGAFFMLGAYVGYSAVHWTGSFWAALIVAPILVGGFGAAFELGILRRLYGRDGHAFLMVTFGLTLIMGEVDPPDLGRRGVAGETAG